METAANARIIELEVQVDALQTQVAELTRTNQKILSQNAALRNQVPVGIHTTAANTATPESSIWNVMDRLGRRERFFNEDQTATTDGNTLKDKIKRFAAPSKLIVIQAVNHLLRTLLH